MPQTALQYLNSRLDWYTPPPGYFNAHRTHRAAIETRLDNWYGVKEMFETGSLKHGTGVRFYSDADYFVVLKGERPASSGTALTKVRDALAGRFQTTDVRVSNPAVRCKFANGKETVEVVPAYPTAASGGYYIPDPTGNWMQAFPKNHNAYVVLANTEHSGGAKKLARLAKVWKNKRNVPVSSFYLEMRAAKYANDAKTWSLTYSLYHYLNGLKAHSLAAMNDPTGLGSRFNAYSTETKKVDAISKLDTAVTRALLGWHYAQLGDHDAAVKHYKLLFDH